MLIMRPDWSQSASGTIAIELFEQIPSPPLQWDFARHIIGASLELLIAGLCKHPPAPLLKESISDFWWNLHNTTYVYFPGVDDAALDKAVEYSSDLSQVIIIVPTGYGEILENACRHMLLSLAETMNPHQRRGVRRIRKKSSHPRSLAMRIPIERHMPLITTLDTYISFRTSFTAADLGWTRNRAVLELFRRYNRRAIDAACDEAILVDIPPE